MASPGRTVLLPSEDAALYEAHLAQFREQYQPLADRSFWPTSANSSNLGIQEGRLRRQAEKDLVALRALQQPGSRQPRSA